MSSPGLALWMVKITAMTTDLTIPRWPHFKQDKDRPGMQNCISTSVHRHINEIYDQITALQPPNYISSGCLLKYIIDVQVSGTTFQVYYLYPSVKVYVYKYLSTSMVLNHLLTLHRVLVHLWTAPWHNSVPNLIWIPQ